MMENSIAELVKKEHQSECPVPRSVKFIFDLLACAPLPFGGAPSIAVQNIQEILNSSFQSKLSAVQEEILAGEKLITTTQLEQVEIVERFHRMLQTISRTNVNEKIRFAARLFARGVSSKQELSTDKYEEFLRTLEEISEREISILAILHTIEVNPNPYIDSSMSKKEYQPHRYWGSFKEKVSQELNIPQEQIYPIMKRIERTGLFAMFNGFSFGRVEEGETTSYFDEFFSYIATFDTGVESDSFEE